VLVEASAAQWDAEEFPGAAALLPARTRAPSSAPHAHAHALPTFPEGMPPERLYDAVLPGHDAVPSGGTASTTARSEFVACRVCELLGS
jgi:hypothetical protein